MSTSVSLAPPPAINSRPALLLVGAQEPLAEPILSRLRHDGHEVRAIASHDAPALEAALGSGTRWDALVTLTPAGRSNLLFDEIDDDAFDAALDSQLLSAVVTAQAVLPHLNDGAHIVHVGSRGHQGAWGGAHQMAASAALVAMTRSMALELQPEGYYVNMVASEFIEGRQDSPQNREAVAHAVSMLAAPQSGITGQCLVIDGLASLRMSEARQLMAAPT